MCAGRKRTENDIWETRSERALIFEWRASQVSRRWLQGFESKASHPAIAAIQGKPSSILRQRLAVLPLISSTRSFNRKKPLAIS